ncbi:MAG: N-acetylmuramoyl-L-alanine amidase-like domain-containing protein [Myxococcota bacterium]
MRRLGLIFGSLAALLILSAGRVAPRPFDGFDEGVIPEALIQIARDVRHLPVGERMDHISRPLIGRPYLVDAIGEGQAPDIDPPARYDVFDCMTFIEEVMALAMAPDPRSAPLIRRHLRYTDGVQRYDKRRHFMLQQWIPENLASGWLKDITAEYGETHLLHKRVTPQTWSSWRRRRLFDLPDAALPRGDYTLPVISLDAAQAAAEDLPVGAIIVTVRRAVAHKPIVVTHVGFKVASDDVPRVRHATKLSDDIVRDDRLIWYFDHIRWYDWWEVEGVSILMPQEIGPRAIRPRAVEPHVDVRPASADSSDPDQSPLSSQ